MNYNSGYKFGKSKSGKNGAGKSPAFTMAFGGVCLALTVVCYYLGSIVPGANLTLYAIGSFFTGIMVLETGIGSGLILYAAAGLLLFLFMPNKLAILPYAFFFGPFGIIHRLTEKIGARENPNRKELAIRFAARFCFFMAVFLVGFFCFRELFIGAIRLPDYADAFLVIGGAVMFVIYDIMYGLLIKIYEKRFRNKKGGFKTFSAESRKGPLDDVKLSGDRSQEKNH